MNGEQLHEAEFEEKTGAPRREAARRTAAKEITTNPDYHDPFGRRTS